LLTTIKDFLLDLEIKGRADNTITNYKTYISGPFTAGVCRPAPTT
jgi:hypothetical protein